mmetsp:Transcript_3110/g.4972  ORF Transcript_3110/g.4972 Transcript_3110/m.4972 type:complete len:215 (-) Transcript_3110:1558-2202(-)|eukprot:CAMPEP_0196169796 /NCGR_PEP_ID=MMETSP0911-20130528/4296_1 /TAXON_ID=49265 /ORGANISM="Thalassiosira rotula, Strain GSO102" /LENGTH=214 /DNA_ID=CAMNT_0041436217 /DNA_START=54 /DNA_END=698 /DNA_ORIENTATION=-
MVSFNGVSSALLISCTSVAVAFSPSPWTQTQHDASSTVLSVASPTFSATALSQELLDLFNYQVTQEMAASQFYLSASIWLDGHDWDGMASYMLAESAEERCHALQLIEFANKRNLPVKLQGLEVPNTEWDSPQEVWRDVLKVEQGCTANLLRVAEAANDCQDYAMLAFLNSFHVVQVNSEDSIGKIIAKVTDESKTPGILRRLDHELGLEACRI